MGAAVPKDARPSIPCAISSLLSPFCAQSGDVVDAEEGKVSDYVDNKLVLVLVLLEYMKLTVNQSWSFSRDCQIL